MASAPSSIILRAGAGARAHIARHGLRAADISALPAAAGGPKGLALLALDKFLFGDWLSAPRVDARARLLIGSSVGAWRMGAAAQSDPLAALERLKVAYFAQKYGEKPSPRQVSEECARTADAVLGAQPVWHPARQLVVVTARSRGLLQARGSAARFAAAALANALSRTQLAAWFERVLFAPGEGRENAEIRGVVPADRFGSHLVRLDADNANAALLASGTIPLIAEPVRSPAGAPPGLYWDGGMIDYHLDWNWRSLPGLVLFPHFSPTLVPGWLDKHLPWRRAHGIHLDNLLLVAPSKALLARLPRGKLPDREDFYHFGPDYAARIASWERALGECARMADDFARFIERPDPAQLLPL